MLARFMCGLLNQRKNDRYIANGDVNQLPPEMWIIILNYLDLDDLLTVSAVSSFFNNCTESMWEAKLSESERGEASQQDSSYQYTFFKKFKSEKHSFIVTRPFSPTDGGFHPIDSINNHNNRILSDVYENLSEAQRTAKLRIPLPSLGWGPSFVLELNISKDEAEKLAKEVNQDELRSHIVKIHTVPRGNSPSEVTLIYQKDKEFKELATIAAIPKLN